MGDTWIRILKSVGPKLVPFFKTVAIYFVLSIHAERPSLLAMLIKCLPIISLIVFVLLHGMSLGDEYTFSRRILTGLLFSCVGDALLIWPQYFIYGMGAFAVAQIMYTAAFGFKPLNAPLGIALYVLGTVAVLFLMPGLHGVLAVGVPLYSVLLMTMIWRATARVQFFEELWTWTKLCSCAGGIVFGISDNLIAFNQFYKPLPHAEVLIMTTYYAAQLGIALSVVDSKGSYNVAHSSSQANKRKTSSTSSQAGNRIKKAIPLR